MAGSLTLTTLSDGTYSTSATNLVRGACVAWVSFNGVTTATVNASYNVSSVTRVSTGTYTINFTLKTNLYGPVVDGKVITNTSVNVNNITNQAPVELCTMKHWAC